jgi:hypothetical protein
MYLIQYIQESNRIKYAVAITLLVEVYVMVKTTIFRARDR